MKTVNLLAICLIVGVAICQAPVVTPTCSLTDVNNQNVKVLQWLQSKNVTLNSSPVKLTDTTVCNGEFSNYGTCCDLASMKKLIGETNQKFVGKWGRYISKLARVKGKFLSGFKKMAAKANINDIKNKISSVKINTKIVDKFKAAEALLPETTEDVTAMKEFVEKFNENIEIFKTQGKVCFDAMKTVRANMICAACSARATTFTETQTTTEAKFKIDYNTCSSVVAKCFPIWKMNFQLNSMMQYVTVNLVKKKGDSSTNGFKSEKEMNTNDLSKIREVFRNCKLATPTATALTCSSTVEQFTKDLCAKAISANNENGYIEGDESIDSGVTDEDVNNSEAEIEAAPTTPTTKRVLQSAATTTTNFDMGVSVDTSGSTTYNNLNSDSSAVVPSDSVTTSSAGNTASSLSKIITVLGVAGTALLVEFF